MECGAKEDSEKKIRWKRGREEGTPVRFVFKRSCIPPTLSASNPNAVSGVKSCHLSNRQQTSLFTEF